MEIFFTINRKYPDHGGWYLFFKFANNFTFGGITGLAVLVAKTGVMSASDFTFLTNMLLLLLGFIVLGKNLD